MTVPNKVISIMQLYLGDRRVWTVEEMGQALDVSTSTAYRYVKELCAAGFLDPVTGAGYALGPAIIQFDHLLREGDPLIRVATPHMKGLIDSADQRADVILCRRFKDRVLCVHEENGNIPHPPTSYIRGVAMPLFLGATSKVILAHLPERALKRIYLENEARIRQVSVDMSWAAFREELKAVKREGFSLTVSEVAVGRMGLAAPVFREGQVIASISLVADVDVYEELRRRIDVVSAVQATADAISHGVAQSDAEIARS